MKKPSRKDCTTWDGHVFRTPLVTERYDFLREKLRRDLIKNLKCKKRLQLYNKENDFKISGDRGRCLTMAVDFFYDERGSLGEDLMCQWIPKKEIVTCNNDIRMDDFKIRVLKSFYPDQITKVTKHSFSHRWVES